MMTILRRTPSTLGAVLLAACLAPDLAAQDGPGLELTGEHRFLQGLAGEWSVHVAGEEVGTATGRLRLEDQFVEVEIRADAEPVGHALYTFGFDARHGRFTVIAMDDTGTYWVTAQGERDGDRVIMYGEDDDPNMAAMGIEKAFVIELAVAGADAARIETRLIDTRTPARTELPFFGFDLRRR